MQRLRNAKYAMDDAVTKAKRLERDAAQLGQPDLANKIKRLKGELEDLEYELVRLERELQ